MSTAKPWQVSVAYVLAMHLIGRHADPLAITRSGIDNLIAHDYEHRGPGTIRDHSPDSWEYDSGEVELILEELEQSEQTL